jgi:hypothetical protein
MMNFRSKIKKGFLAIFAFALIVGATVKAQAIEIAPNDLVLVLYGNNTEYYQLIGQTPDILNTGGNFNISGANLNAAGPAATTQWALVSFNTTTGDFSGDVTDVNITFRGSTVPSNIPADAIYNNLAVWAGNVTAASTDPNSGTFPKSDTASFFNQVDFGNGDGRLAALPPGTSATGSYGQTLTILAGDFNTGNITNTGTTASLSLINPSDLAAGALLAITAPAPVPLPASVVLFASGLVGLIGVARRRLIGA